MSTISSVGLSTATQPAEKVRRRPDGPVGGTDFAANMKSGFESAARAAGVHEGKIAGLLEDVMQVIAKASSRTLDSKDPGVSLQAAVNSVLKRNGVDVDRFQAAMDARGDQSKAPAGPGTVGGVQGLPPVKKPEGPEKPKQPEMVESTASTDSTKKAGFQELLESLAGGTTEKDKQSLLAFIKQQSVGNGEIVDVAV
jgi:hypothetical protein